MSEQSHADKTQEICIDRFTAAIEALTDVSIMFDDIDFNNKAIKLVIGDLCTAREHLNRDLGGG